MLQMLHFDILSVQIVWKFPSMYCWLTFERVVKSYRVSRVMGALEICDDKWSEFTNVTRQSAGLEIGLATAGAQR